LGARAQIRSLDITLHKHSSTMMGWLYRMLLSAFADRITSSVEHAVVVTLRSVFFADLFGSNLRKILLL